MKRNRGDLVAVLIAVVLVLCAGTCAAAEPGPAPVFIAHAGGAVNGRTYTNSLEALNHNYNRGHRFFEIDFSWTADDELVAIHDWGGESNTFRDLFYVPKGMKTPTRAQFLRLQTKGEMTQLSLEGILGWAKSKGDVYIVTDVKDRNLQALQRIKALGQARMDLVIPQVYSYAEYGEARKIGFRKIILTLYRMKVHPGELLDFVRANSPFAVTMPWPAAQAGLASFLQRTGVRVYAHTVNDLTLFASLRKKGVFGIYTDHIYPP